ncbi:hypothetical protein SEUBUCD650_0B03490 [Saccharomyces eubayanus]|uniref:Uncharacterized protein n=1 Tax=Saccharomyces eubayanus TaxID=1080349 RepID=A0ABN8VN62_SACEU|nr:hypothetical protein SEUBUCD650_0B03490 [Saccharomyces eubayanus]
MKIFDLLQEKGITILRTSEDTLAHSQTHTHIYTYTYTYTCLRLRAYSSVCLPAYVGAMLRVVKTHRLQLPVISSEIPGENSGRRVFFFFFHFAPNQSLRTARRASLHTGVFYGFCGNSARTSSERGHEKIFHCASQRSSGFQHQRAGLAVLFGLWSIWILACVAVCFLFKVGLCPFPVGVSPLCGPFLLFGNSTLVSSMFFNNSFFLIS